MKDVGFGAWMAVALIFGVWLAITAPASAHVTKCPDPAGVELAQWWDVDTQTDTEDCTVSVNAGDIDTAKALGSTFCPGEIVGVRAQSREVNRPFRSKRYQ